MSDRVDVTYFYSDERKSSDDEGDNDDDDDGFYCSHSTNLIFDKCILEAVQSRMCDLLGCSSPYLPSSEKCPDCEINLFNATYAVCTVCGRVYGLNSFVRKSEAPVSRAQSSFRSLHRSLLEFDQTSLCPSPCVILDDAKGFATFKYKEPLLAQITLYYRCCNISATYA